MLPCKVLIIDDDETIKFSFETFLSNSKFNIQFASNGKEGLKHLSSFNPDIVIADYKMPEMSGMEFIKASKIISPKVPIIIISAFGDTSTQNSFLAEGAHRYIEKPFDIETMIHLIEESVHHLNPQTSSNKTQCNFISAT